MKMGYISTVWNKLIVSVTILALNIFLPTLDVYSDLNLIYIFFSSDQPLWATLLSVPFLLNYCLTWTLWWRVDGRKCVSWEKIVSGVTALLGCYPQFYAGNILRMIWIDFEKGMKMKKKFERNFAELEIFAESVFSLLVMTYIIRKVHMDINDDSIDSNKTILYSIGGIDANQDQDCKMDRNVQFLVAYYSSAASAALGMATCLKNGPCRVLGEGGTFGGLLTVKFILLVISTFITLASKEFYGQVDQTFIEKDQCNDALIQDGIIFTTEGKIVAISTLFIPGLLVALMSLCPFNNFFKTIISHPSLLLMPIFTHYTFTVNNKSCTKKEEDFATDTRIIFSKKWTIVNIVVSLLGHFAYAVIFNTIQGNCFPNNFGPHCVLFHYMKLGLPCAIAGVVSTILFLFMDQCCGTWTPEFQISVLKVNEPLTEFVVYKDICGIKKIVAMDELNNDKNNNDMELKIKSSFREPVRGGDVAINNILDNVSFVPEDDIDVLEKDVKDKSVVKFDEQVIKRDEQDNDEVTFKLDELVEDDVEQDEHVEAVIKQEKEAKNGYVDGDTQKERIV